uniref:F-box domain-containing protein n=1 Tax=Meloidogyne incognita TaxID=6306 RepID=A0A914LC87_MELIC
MSKNYKIIEHEGVKYYKEEGQWNKICPIKEDEVPDAVKNKMLSKFNLLPEIQLDVLKYLDFTQLVSVQQTNVYFKNFIYEHGKVLARKKYLKLRIYQINERQLNNCKERMPSLNLYDFKWDKIEPCEQKQKFFKLEPQLYEFQLSEQLEEKWKDAIEKQIPLFLSTDDFSTVIFALEQRFKGDREQYYFQLMNFPKNIEEMKITRYFFQLLFNCAFKFFEVSCLIINPQMIELLFDENITNLPLQLHSQLIELVFLGDYSLNFILNHLIAADLFIDCDIVKDMDLLFQILNLTFPLLRPAFAATR